MQPAHEATTFLEGSLYVTIDRSYAVLFQLHQWCKDAVSFSVTKAVTKTYLHPDDRPTEQIPVNRLVPFVRTQRTIMANQLKTR